MHLGQVRVEGSTFAAVFENGMARPIPSHSMVDLIRRSETQNIPLPALARQLASRHADPLPPVLPIHPPEVWACECTYEASSPFGEAGNGTRDMYVDVHREPRPEIFFKGTARVCVASGQAIGIRADSRFTAPEPELALVLGSRGRIAGYTLANDVSALDIERENALYLPQSKIYDGCCALGPVMVTTDQLPDPYALEIACTITRDGQALFHGEVSTAKLQRRMETLLEYLMRSNRVPLGSVLLTGTGIIVPPEAALAPGDAVSIRVREIGELTNHAAIAA
jgi:2-dehydro-3-deoxy-D-arabinonate dehydratase